MSTVHHSATIARCGSKTQDRLLVGDLVHGHPVGVTDAAAIVASIHAVRTRGVPPARAVGCGGGVPVALATESP